jgi:hypothetical protein
MAVPWRIHQKGITSMAMLWSMYQLVWRDDEKITWEDFPEIAMGSGGLFLLWAPEALTIAAVSTTPLVVLEAAVVIGAVASVAIAGEEGLNTYVDYITDPVDMIQDPEKAESLLLAHRIVQAGVTMGGSELARGGANLIMDFKDEIFKNRYLTGPYLPF